MRGRRGCLSTLVLWAVIAVVVVWGLTVTLNPWALHIGGQSTPLLYWHGWGTVVSKDGKSYPLYVNFSPDRPGRHTTIPREGKHWNADLRGRGWLAPGSEERMEVSGTMYGGYMNTDDSLFSFRLLEWRKPFSINPPNRGYFDVAGQFRGSDLVMDRSDEQGHRLNSGPFIDHATVTLRWGSYEEFEAACRSGAGH